MLEALYKKKDATRLSKFLTFVCIIFVGLAFRLVYLQLIEGEFYSSKAEGNRSRVLPMTAARGVIYDRNGQIMASSRPSFMVSIMPTGKDLDAGEVNRLAGILNIPVAEIEKKVKEHKSGYEPIRLASDVGMDIVTKIEENRDTLPAVTIEVVPIRYYPKNNLAAQVLGYVGEVSEEEISEAKMKDPNSGLVQGSITGRAGLERMYDGFLRGTDGGRRVEVDATGRPVAELGRKTTVPGQAIHLTIDMELQEAAQKAVEEQIGILRSNGWPSTGAAVIAMDPNSGAILAMASYPDFNPNLFARGITMKEWDALNNNPNHPFENRAISGEYPPGSPFKIITGAAALELKKVTTDELIFDSGRHWLIDKRNAEGEALGWINFDQALSKSDNVYFYEMGNRVGIENIDRYAKMFGLGEKTGIKLYGEASGNLASPEYKRKVFDQDWYLGETFDAAIGQSFHLTTPLQMTVMMAQIANGGIRYEPYLVSRVDKADGTPLEVYGAKKTGTLQVSQSVMNIIRNGLRNVAAEGGTAGEIFQKFPITVAGKTGTSENAMGTDHSWFVAYAPFDKPRIVVVAIVEQGGFGAGSAGPIAKAVLAAFFKVPNTPTTPTTPKPVTTTQTVPTTGPKEE